MINLIINLHIPKHSEELSRSKCIQFQNNFQHENSKEEPVSFIKIKTNEPGIHKYHEVKEVAEGSEIK